MTKTDRAFKALKPNTATVIAAGLLIAGLPWIPPALLTLSDDAWGYRSVNGMRVLLLQAVILLLAGLLVMVTRNRRQLALASVLIAYVIVSGLAVVSLYKAYPLSRNLWVKKLEGLALASMPVADAIKRYQADTGSLPDRLTELVPKYLPEIPRPQQSETSKYEFTRNVLDAPDLWQLRISFAGYGFDEFIYLPSEQYPKEGWGGKLEPIGKWAYVHE